jgi:electron transport complex protein RnfB
VAVINADRCTGCQACVAVCPRDCIHLIETGLRVKGIHAWCEVDMQQCTGCTLCVALPQGSTDSYQLKVCPWDAIEMVPTEFLPDAVEHIGGPEDYTRQNRPRLLATAQQLAATRLKQQSQ